MTPAAFEARAGARLAEALALAPADARHEARALTCAALGVNRSWLAAHDTDPLPPAAAERLDAWLVRRAAGEPLAYLTGRKEFYGLDFRVGPAVLIPRPETELLVEVALECLPADAPADILELATGSGAVAVSLARHRPRARLLATDLSVDALRIARVNACAHGVSNVRFQCADWYAGLSPARPDAPPAGAGKADEAQVPAAADTEPASKPAPTRTPNVTPDMVPDLIPKPAPAVPARRPADDALPARFELILANPPYVPEADPHLTHLRFEPRLALVAGPDGLRDLRSVIAGASAYLSPGGRLAVEHGFDQVASVRALFAATGFTAIESRRDLAGIERVTLGRLGARKGD